MFARTPHHPRLESNMYKLAAICAVVALLACGCATEHPAQTVEMEPLPGFDVEYQGEVGDGTAVTGDMPEYTQPEDQPDWMYTMEVRFVRCSHDDAVALFGERINTVGAWSMDSGALETGKDNGLTLVSAPRLSVFEKQTGTISILNQIAYIKSFQISSEGSTRVADPVVDTLAEGLVLGLRVQQADAGSMKLEIDVTQSSVMRPIESQDVQVFGAPMTIQVPVMYTQRLKAQGEVSEDRTLVLTGMIESGDQVSLVLINGKRTKVDYEPEQPKDK